MSEADLAKPVVAYFQERGWTVYQEVSTGMGNPRADIVATLGPVAAIIECKARLSWDVLDQCSYWVRMGSANFVFAAAPLAKRPKCLPRVLDALGVGLLNIHADGVLEHHRAPFHRAWYTREGGRRRGRLMLWIGRYLNENQRSGEYAAAGTTGGQHWTPFRETCRAVRAAVEKKPGMNTKELIASVEHHYQRDSTARACIAKMVEKGVVEGVEARRESRGFRYYPKVVS